MKSASYFFQSIIQSRNTSDIKCLSLTNSAQCSIYNDIKFMSGNIQRAWKIVCHTVLLLFFFYVKGSWMIKVQSIFLVNYFSVSKLQLKHYLVNKLVHCWRMYLHYLGNQLSVCQISSTNDSPRDELIGFPVTVSIQYWPKSMDQIFERRKCIIQSNLLA